MRIHKEGYGVIAKAFCIIALMLICICLIAGWCTGLKIALVLGVILFLFIVRFFRSPKRVAVIDESFVVAAADGKVVFAEKVTENEYLKCECIQVSIFMSIFNVHVNYFPVGGKVLYTNHHHGDYMMAWHPKSSEKNERTTVVVETNNGTKVLFRQIAGYVARRIVCYPKVGERVNQCNQMGFIKFGSRVDIFLPLDAEITVRVGDKVTACQTIVAKLKEK